MRKKCPERLTLDERKAKRAKEREERKNKPRGDAAAKLRREARKNSRLSAKERIDKRKLEAQKKREERKNRPRGNAAAKIRKAIREGKRGSRGGKGEDGGTYDEKGNRKGPNGCGNKGIEGKIGKQPRKK